MAARWWCTRIEGLGCAQRRSWMTIEPVGWIGSRTRSEDQLNRWDQPGVGRGDTPRMQFQPAAGALHATDPEPLPPGRPGRLGYSRGSNIYLLPVNSGIFECKALC